MILKKLDSALRKKKVLTPLKTMTMDPFFIDQDRRFISHAVAFDFLGYDLEHLNLVQQEALEAWNEGVLGMPAETTYFEHDWVEPMYGAVKSCHIVNYMDEDVWPGMISSLEKKYDFWDRDEWHYIESSPDGLWVGTYIYVKAAGVFIGIPYRYLIARADGLRCVVLPIPRTLEAGPSRPDDPYKKAYNGWANVSANQPIALSFTLNIKGVTWETKSAPRLFKKTQKKKPAFEYKRVTVRPGEVISKSVGKRLDSRQSPRLHLRRGHIRRFADHKVWIKPMWVGDAAKGVIKNDYDVRNSRHLTYAV
jgi:hypothetical protein